MSLRVASSGRLGRASKLNLCQLFWVAILAATLSGVISTICFAGDLLSDEVDQSLTVKTRQLLFGDSFGGVFTNPPSNLLFDFGDEATQKIAANAADATGTDVAECQARNAGLSAGYSDLLSKATWSKDLLTATDRSALDSLKQLLFVRESTPTSEYANYLKYKKIFDDTNTDLDRTPPAQRTSSQQNAAKQAREDLNLLGNAAKYAVPDIKYRTLSQRAQNTHLAAYQAKLPAGGPEVARNVVRFAPSLDEISSGEFWTAVSFKAPLTGLPAWLGTTLSVSLKSARVAVFRSWFAEDLFSDDSWRLPTIISDGTGGGEIGQYITALLFIKDLSIEIVSSPGAKGALRDALSRKDVVRAGPFVLANRSLNNGPFVAHVDAPRMKIQVSQIQLFGCQAASLPKAPNPNTGYEW